LAEFPGSRKAETAVVEPVFQSKKYKGARCALCAPVIHLSKLCRISESKVFWKCIRPGKSHNSTALIVLYRNPLPALNASCFQHEPAATRFHAFAKSMRFRTTAIVRLVRPLWHTSAPSKTLNLTQIASLKTESGSANLSRLPSKLKLVIFHRCGKFC